MRRTRWKLLDSPLTGYREDPLSAVANLFDIALVFVAVLVAVIATTLRLPELLNPATDIAVIRKLGSQEVEIVLRKGKKVTAYRATDYTVGGYATRLGVAYRLEDGQIVYVPEHSAGERQGPDHKNQRPGP